MGQRKDEFVSGFTYQRFRQRRFRDDATGGKPLMRGDGGQCRRHACRCRCCHEVASLHHKPRSLAFAPVDVAGASGRCVPFDGQRRGFAVWLEQLQQHVVGDHTVRQSGHCQPCDTMAGWLPNGWSTVNILLLPLARPHRPPAPHTGARRIRLPRLDLRNLAQATCELLTKPAEKLLPGIIDHRHKATPQPARERVLALLEFRHPRPLRLPVPGRYRCWARGPSRPSAPSRSRPFRPRRTCR